jgi:hypothetical protein
MCSSRGCERGDILTLLSCGIVNSGDCLAESMLDGSLAFCGESGLSWSNKLRKSSLTGISEAICCRTVITPHYPQLGAVNSEHTVARRFLKRCSLVTLWTEMPLTARCGFRMILLDRTGTCLDTTFRPDPAASRSPGLYSNSRSP